MDILLEQIQRLLSSLSPFRILCFADHPFLTFWLCCAAVVTTQSELQPVLGGLVTVGCRTWGTENGLNHFVATVGEHR